MLRSRTFPLNQVKIDDSNSTSKFVGDHFTETLKLMVVNQELQKTLNYNTLVSVEMTDLEGRKNNIYVALEPKIFLHIQFNSMLVTTILKRLNWWVIQPVLCKALL